MGSPTRRGGLAALQSLLQEGLDHDHAQRYAEAARAYQAYLAQAPFHAEVWADLGGVQRMAGAFEEAERACRKALALKADLAPAKVDLAHLLLRRQQPQEAEALCRQVLARHPDHVPALTALADALAQRGALAEAQAVAERAWTLDPASADARSRFVHLSFRRRDLAALFRAEEPDYAKLPPELIPYERSLWHLLFGHFQEGWRGYEHRLLAPGFIRSGAIPRGPRWLGESFEGRTLLLHWEQGLGDTLMCLRYLPWVKALGGRVVLVVQPALRDLAATCPGADEILPDGSPLPAYDLHTYLLSLPGLFLGRGVPDTIPYLGVPETVPHRAELAAALGSAGEALRIGVVWGGNPAYRRDAERSIPGALWGPLGDLPGLAWFGLQLDRPDAPPLPGLTDLGPHLGTFADTAFALAHLDLLISVDTSVAHLAGALGVPTFLLLPYQPDWRWLLDRDDSPWYPHHRLYRQPLPGDWASVFRQIARDLSGEG